MYFTQSNQRNGNSKINAERRRTSEDYMLAGKHDLDDDDDYIVLQITNQKEHKVRIVVVVLDSVCPFPG